MFFELFPEVLEIFSPFRNFSNLRPKTLGMLYGISPNFSQKRPEFSAVFFLVDTSSWSSPSCPHQFAKPPREMLLEFLGNSRTDLEIYYKIKCFWTFYKAFRKFLQKNLSKLRREAHRTLREGDRNFRQKSFELPLELQSNSGYIFVWRNINFHITRNACPEFGCYSDQGDFETLSHHFSWTSSQSSLTFSEKVAELCFGVFGASFLEF